MLRHELKALRYICENYHARKIAPEALPPMADFMTPQGREIYQTIMHSPDRETAETALKHLDLENVDIGSFLRLSGEHYYSYPALVIERAAAIRSGALKVAAA